jgi:ABC-type nickel/cobalt efflux system permease component RcnA
MLASLVAVLFILFAALVLNLTGDAMGNAANWIGIGSYAMVALLGLWLIIRHVFGLGHRHGHRHAGAADDRHDRAAARALLYGDDEDEDDDHAGHDHADHDHHHGHGIRPVHVAPARVQQTVLARAFENSALAARRPAAVAAPALAYADAGPAHGHAAHAHDHAPHAAHSHVAVVPGQLRRGGWRESLGVVLAIGLRPCSGALVVLVFALSQGVLWAGIASVFLMGLGTAITVAALATLAMTAKGLARKLSKGRPGAAAHLVWWGELAGACLVFGFGILLVVANLWG